MSNVKGKGQRLIPEELLKYLEALKNKYPNAVDLIEANPTLEGGEDSLSSVLINGTKYAVGGGSDIHLYRHRIAFTSSAGVLYTEIYNANEVAYTISSLGDEFGQYYDFPTTIEFSFNDSKLMIGVGVGQNQNVIRMKEITTSFMESTSEITSITDTVTLIL